MRPSLLLVAPFFLTGCALDFAPSGPLQRETKTIERDNAELVKVDLKMGAGELRVDGGAAKLMDADFSYNVPSWKPDVRYNNTGVRGYLTIEQPTTSKVAGQNHYIWDLKLNNDVPVDLRVHFGAGEAKLNLGSLSLRSVEVDMGVGEIKIDLRGEPKRDYDVHIRGGVGEATVYLPRDVGVYADASGGIGGVKATGLKKQGSHYVNDVYETSKVKIHLDVRGGVGSINLIGS